MKNLFVLVVIVAVGWFAWQKFSGGGAPLVIKNPIFGEMRASVTMQNREIEMAMFVRMENEFVCQSRAREVAQDVLKDCPTCSLQPVKCQASLPPRYSRLFNDAPIASPYLSLTSGDVTERDGRLVVYGLTDHEGVTLCEQLRSKIKEHYRGEAHCVPPSGG